MLIPIDAIITTRATRLAEYSCFSRSKVPNYMAAVTFVIVASLFGKHILVFSSLFDYIKDAYQSRLDPLMGNGRAMSFLESFYHYLYLGYSRSERLKMN